MFTEWYGMSPYIEQRSFVFERLKTKIVLLLYIYIFADLASRCNFR